MDASNKAEFLNVIDAWLGVKGFAEKIQNENETIYIREFSPLADHQLTIVTVKPCVGSNAKVLQADVKETNRKNIKTVEEYRLKGNKLTRFFSKLNILPYILYYADDCSAQFLGEVENSMPFIYWFHAIANISQKTVTSPKKRPLFGQAKEYLLNLDFASLMTPIFQPAQKVDAKLVKFLEDIRLMNPKDQKKIWKEREYKHEFDRFLGFANRAVYDVTFKQGDDLARKALLCHYIARSSCEKVMPSRYSAGPDISNAFETAKLQMEDSSRRDKWVSLYTSPIHKQLEAKELINIAYCPDCKKVQQGFELDGHHPVCPENEKHKKLTHFITILPEEMDLFNEKLVEKYRRRGLFG